MNSELNRRISFKQQFKKRCFLFSISVLKLAEQFRKNRNNWSLLDQLIRSGTSIGANIVEGGNSSSKREFLNYFQIALKSSSETLYWLALLQEMSGNSYKEISEIINECTELKKMISTIILNTKDNSRF